MSVSSSARVRRFRVIDNAPLATRMREAAAAGQPMFLCGTADPKLLGEVEATNAANAVLAGREQWPHVKVDQMYAVEMTFIDGAWR